MKKISILLILIFVTIHSSYSGQKNYLYINAKSGLKLRSGAGITFKKILTLPYNSQVSVIEYSKKKVTIAGKTASWAKVNYYGKEGWLFCGFTSKKPLKTFTIVGKFTDASRGDCFNLSFKDRKNKTWDFGDGNNNFDFEKYFTEVDDGEWRINKKYKNSFFKITAATLKGKVCEGCEGCRVDGDVLTIIKLTVVK